MPQHPLIYVVAAEASGEQLGAALIENIKTSAGLNVRLAGIGGPEMARCGIVSPIDISPLSVLGFIEAVKAYPKIRRLIHAACDDIIARDPDMVVMIDSWGFMIRVAQRLRQLGFKGQLVKYVGPQVWAMREGRTKVLAASFDHLLTIHSFDAPYFEREGVPVTYVGNPIFDTDFRAGNGADLRGQYGIAPEAPVLAVLFGSRRSEAQRLAPVFASAIERLKRQIPDIHFIAPLASNVATQVMGLTASDPRLQNIILVKEARKLDVFDAANAALACSGTVTTQLACAGVPTVLAYKLNGLTWVLASRLYKPEFVGIVNIAAGKALMPEFLQGKATGDSLSSALKPFLTDKAFSDQSRAALIAQTDEMRSGDIKASARAADAVLDLAGIQALKKRR